MKPFFFQSLSMALVASFALTACQTEPKSSAWAGPKPQQEIVLIPQWHLAATDDGKKDSLKLPQRENQLAIYDQLVKWTENGIVSEAIVEGCQGDIDDSFTTRFNGWTLAELRTLKRSDLDQTLTQIGIKLKARLGGKIIVRCGDDLELVRAHQLALSDLRGLIGYKARLAQYANDPKRRKGYLESARDSLKLPPKSSDQAIIAAIDREARNKLDLFKALVKRRDETFVRTASQSSVPLAIVIGALHVPDLKEQLEAAGKKTSVFTPAGLKGDESELIEKLDILLKAPGA